MTDFMTWLEQMSRNSNDQRREKRLARLLSLLKSLESKEVLSKDASRTIMSLRRLVDRVNNQPERANRFIDRCYSEISAISVKFYGLVREGHYQNEWIANGAGLGVAFGVIAYSLTGNAAWLAIGISLGVSIGFGIGAAIDRKALNDHRVLETK